MDDFNKARFFFSRIPKRLLQAHNLLDRNDRELLVQVAAWHPKPCFYSVDYFTETILGIGDKAFYRALYKLSFLGLIQIKKGNRKRPNNYIFIDDPSLWRLPKNLADNISNDHEKLGLGTIQFKEKGFINEYGFKVAFNSAFPKYQLKLNKVDNSQSEEKILTDTPVRETLEPAEQGYFDLLKNLTSIHRSEPKIIADYYKNREKITAIKSAPKEEQAPNERNYFLTLEAAFFEISSNPKDDLVRPLLVFAVNLEACTINDEEIYTAIREETRRLRNSI